MKILVLIPIFIILLLLLARVYFFIVAQKHTQCTACKSKDTERIERGFFVKRVLLLQNTHRYWCRKCWKYFYVNI